MAKETVTILCSGVALGVYVPSLIVSYQLQSKGLATEVVTLENLIFKEKRRRIPLTKVAFHRNFKVALAAEKLLRDIVPSLDPFLVSNLLQFWKEENRRCFIVFSGFWLPILERYVRSRSSQDISVDLCHVDSAISPSWKLYNKDYLGFRHVWFANWSKKMVSFRLRIFPHETIPYNKRHDRFVIHGGGWGVGTYKDKIPTLEKLGFKLDVITYEKRDLVSRNRRNRYFMIDSRWNPWEKDSHNQLQFPPFGEVKQDEVVEFKNNPAFQEQYLLTRQSKAVISKPGGATLLDSVSSATPIILLEPYGEHEEKNAQLWEYLGFGISYKKWADCGWTLKVLEELNSNLMKARERIRDYVEWYCESKEFEKIRPKNIS